MRNPFQRRKENPIGAATLGFYGGRAQYRVTDVEAYAKEGYMSNPDVYSAIEIFSNAAGAVDWGVEKKVRGEWEPLDTHPMLDLLERPNPRMSGTGLIRALVKWRLIGGEFYLARNEKPSGPPRELWVLPVHRMKILPGRSPMDPVAAYEYQIGANKQPMNAADVLHLPRFHPTDDFYGFSPLEAAARMIDQANSAADFNLGLLQNGGIPPGFLKSDEELGDKSFARLKAAMAKWGQASESGKPQLLEGGLTWQDAARTPAEMQFLEAQRMFALKFAQVIGLPAEFLSGADEKKYNNASEAHRVLYTVGVLPELDDVRDGLNFWLAPMFGDDVRLVYKTDSIDALQEDEDKRWARADASDDLTIDETRALKGFEPLPDGAGEVLLVPFSLAPLASVTAERPDDPEPEPDDEGGDEPDPDPDAPAGKSRRKALNVPDAQKAAYWKLVDAKRTRLEDAVTQMMAARLKADAEAVVAAISGAPTPPAAVARAEKALDAQKKAWLKLQKDAWLKVGKPFADDVLSQLKNDAGPDRVKAPDLDTAWIARVTAYLGKHGAQHVQGIIDTTKQQVASSIQKGIDEGEGIPEIAKRVSAHQLEEIIPNRARTIARTETVSASNAASVAAAKSTELPLQKEWIETADDRTRESHMGIDAVGLDDEFTLGSGATLEFPGDSSGSADADDIVNCRCAVAYRIADES